MSKLIIIINTVLLIVFIEVVLFFISYYKFEDNEINKLKYFEKYHISKLYVKKKLVDKNLINDEFIKDKKIYYKISNNYQYEVIELDDILGWRLKKNVIKFKSNLFSKDLGYFIHNSNGFAQINKEIFKKKENQINRIIITGGSTVYGDGVVNFDQTLPYIFESKINEKSNLKFEIINAGVGGYHSGQEYLYYINTLQIFNPDLLIMYNGINDFTWLDLMKFEKKKYSYNEYYNKIIACCNKRMSKDKYISLSYNLKNFAEGFMIIDIIKNQISPKLYQNINVKKIDFKKDDLNFIYSNYINNYYSKNIENLIQIAIKNNFKFSFVLQPFTGTNIVIENNIDHFDFTKEEKEKRLNFYNLMRKKIIFLQKKYNNFENICLFDLSKNTFKNTKEIVYEDGVHLTKLGNEFVSDKLIEELNNCYGDQFLN